MEAPAPPSLSDALDDDTMGAFLSQCSVPALRSLNTVSQGWRQRVRTALRARVRESDHSLAIDGLSWTELDWLLCALQRDGVNVEKLRCEQATISFAPLLAAPRVGPGDLRGCVGGGVSDAATHRRLLGAAALCVVRRGAALARMNVKNEDEPWDAAFAHALGAAAVASASLATLNMDGFALPIRQLKGTEPMARWTSRTSTSAWRLPS
jgi:hypothetical protein